MIKKVTLVYVVVSLLTATAVLAGNGANKSTYGELSAVSLNSDSGYIIYAGVSENAWFGNDVWVALYEEGGWPEIFACYTQWMGDPPVYSLNINPSAKKGTFEIDTSTLECYGETPPQIISGECTVNGEFSEKENSKARGEYSDGYSYITHTITVREGADCTVTAAGVLYDQSLVGYLMHTQVVEKLDESDF